MPAWRARCGVRDAGVPQKAMLDCCLCPSESWGETNRMMQIAAFLVFLVMGVTNLLAVQAGLTVAHKSGVYVGAWASNLAGWGTFGGANMELDLIGGYKTKISPNGTLDVGLTWYMYPGGAAKTDFATTNNLRCGDIVTVDDAAAALRRMPSKSQSGLSSRRFRQAFSSLTSATSARR